MSIEITPDTDSLNSNYDTLDVECLRCGKCCKMPGTEEYCKYLEYIPDMGYYKCTIYNSREGRYLGKVPAGKVYCFPRMYKMDIIEGCPYTPFILNIKRLIKND